MTMWIFVQCFALQVWFQNQRAKMKKMQKKARHDNKACTDVENDEKKVNVKEEEQSPSSVFFNDSCSDNETTADDRVSQPRMQPKHFSNIKEELELDGHIYKSNNRSPLSFNPGILGSNVRRDYKGISFPPSLDSGQQAMFMTPPLAHQNPPHGQSGLNPIDRLYSMQNSYFCVENEGIMEH